MLIIQQAGMNGFTTIPLVLAYVAARALDATRPGAD
jgi:hypothetical protein